MCLALTAGLLLAVPGQTLAQDPTPVFSTDADYRILTRYGSTTEIELADYLDAGATGTTFSLKSCDSLRTNYHGTPTITSGKLVLPSNTLGHVHGTNSETETVCTVTGTHTDMTTEDQDFSLYTVPDRVPPGLQPGAPSVAEARATAPPPTVTVSFGAPTYTVPEGGTISVTVLLSDAPGRELLIPLTETPGGGATHDDYYDILSRLIFSPTQTSWLFTFTATDDTDDNDGKTVTLGFGTLPPGVAAGTYPTATITITDNVDPPAPPPTVTVSFGAPTYTVPEGGTISVTVLLSDAPGREVLIPLTETPGGGATRDDYYGVLSRLIFGPTQTSWLFTFTATDDTDDDDGKTVTLGFGTLPPGVAAGTYPTATITITDNVDPPAPPPTVTVSFGAPTYTVPEGGTILVTVLLSDAPGREVLIPLTETPGGGATHDDYYDILSRLIFGPTQTSWLFTFTATDDTDDDDGETVTLGFGTLPPGVAEGTYPTATVTITSNDTSMVGDPPAVIATPTMLTFPEGSGGTYTVVLTSRPTGPVTVTPTVVGARDVTVDRPSLTFTVRNWDIPQTVTVRGADDDDTTNDWATIEHGVSGANYESVATRDVDVTVIDDSRTRPLSDRPTW